MMTHPAELTPQVLALVRSAFDRACARVPARQLTQRDRITMAERVLQAAAAGERDPARLLRVGLMAHWSRTDTPARDEALAD